MFEAIYNFFGSIILFCYRLFGDYTVALFFFTLVMQVILLPLAIKQQKNSIKQARLAPKIMAIRNKYKGRNDQATQKKMQEETLDLYQRENFNPAGGCMPLLIQLPIIMLLYNVVRMPLSYILKYSADTIAAIQKVVEATGVELSQATLELDLAHHMSQMGEGAFSGIDLGGNFPDFKLFGLDLTQTPLKDGKVTSWALMLIPLITFIAMYGSQKIIRHFTYVSPDMKEQQNNPSMKIMMIVGPLMSVYFAAVWPGTLGVYWILRNILQTVQQIALAKIMPVPTFTEEDYKAAERELAGKSKKKTPRVADPNKPKVKSLHYIDADDDDEPAPEPKAKKNDKPSEDTADAGENSSASDNAEEKAEAAESRDDALKGVVAPAPMKEDRNSDNK